MIRESTEQNLLNAVTQTTTSSPMSVEGYSRVGFYMERSNHGSGASAFTFEGTIDGANWIALNVLVDNVTNAIAEGLTRVAGKSLASNATAFLWLNLQDFPLKAVRAVVTETTDGTHDCFAIASA